MIFEGFVKRFAALKGGTAPLSARMTHQESLAVAPVEPDGFEMTRAGRRMLLAPQSTVTGIAPVQALPTTAAQWAIWNADPTKSYVFDWLGIYLVSGTAGAGIVLLACYFVAPAQLGIAPATGMSIQNASGGSAIGSKAVVKSAVTISGPSAPIWFPIAKCDSANTAVGSVAAENRDIRGRLILPPGVGLGLAVVSPAGTTPLYAPYGAWNEHECDLE